MIGLLCFLGLTQVHASDMNHYLGDTIDFQTELEKQIEQEKKQQNGLKKDEEDEDFLGTGQLSSETQEKMSKELRRTLKEAKGESTLEASGSMNTELTDKEKVNSKGYTPLGSLENTQDYLEFKSDDVIKAFQNKGNQNFNLVFFKDDFEYHDEQGSFQRTYRENGSEYAALLKFSGHYFLAPHDILNLGAGLGVGIGYNSGIGRFVSTLNKSDARFFLWTVPLDLSFLAELRVTRYLKLSAAGGPSVLGIWQHRNDLGEREKKKDIRQLSPGYFYEAALKISLSEISPQGSLDLFNEYTITKYYLTLSVRGQNYEDFKDQDVTIRGMSFGAGFTFEYF